MYNDAVDQKKRQAGKRYESSIAHKLRTEGWYVEETGRDGTNDHGIDLIARRGAVTRYVQCKGWSSWKTIHEDVVSQLFGSVANIVGVENVDRVEKYIYSPAQLSDYAQGEALRLNVCFVRQSAWGVRRHFGGRHER
jgi:Restriction endonuclease